MMTLINQNDLQSVFHFRSMTDLVNDSTNAQSPKRKFSFRFPHLAHHSSGGDKDLSAASPNSHHKTHGLKTRNFSEEAKNVPDLQVTFILSLNAQFRRFSILFLSTISNLIFLDVQFVSFHLFN